MIGYSFFIYLPEPLKTSSLLSQVWIPTIHESDDFSRFGSWALEQSSSLSALSAFIDIPATIQHKKKFWRIFWDFFIQIYNYKTIQNFVEAPTPLPQSFDYSNSDTDATANPKGACSRKQPANIILVKT